MVVVQFHATTALTIVILVVAIKIPSRVMAQDYDYGEDASDSSVAMEMKLNSKNLTAENAKCDSLIAENLKNHSDDKSTQPIVPTTIDVKLILITLNDISDSTGVLSLTARIDFRWFDTRLALPNDTCVNQTLLIKTQEKIWFPYFIVQNGANSVFYPDAWEKFPATLRSDGHIDWRVAFRFDLSCDMNFVVFPLDSQYCKLLIQSPHFGPGELIYTVGDKSRGVVVLNAEDADHPMWAFQGQALKFTTKVPGVIFYLAFKRKTMYYVWTIAVPTLAVCLLTATTFIIPADGEEKMSTVINGLLSFFLLYLLFVDSFPADSTNISLLMIFFSIQIMLTTVATLVCSVIMRLLCVEQAEEKLLEEEEEQDERLRNSGVRKIVVAPSQHAASVTLRNNVSEARGVKPPPNNAVAPLAEKDVALASAKDVENKKKKNSKRQHLLTAAQLNETSLVVYIASVVLSLIVFVCAYAQILSTAQTDLVYTDINEYIIGE